MVLIVDQNENTYTRIVFVWTVVWTWIDRCVFDDNENVYFYIPLIAKTSKLNFKHGIHATASWAWGPFLESPDNWRPRKAVAVYMKDRSFNGFVSYMIKLSVNETNRSI